MAVVSWNNATATPSQPVEQILFTSGGTVTIETPASVVFDVITGFSRYSEWNTWTTALSFPQADADVGVGAEGKLKAEMQAQKRAYDIPIEACRPINIILILERTPNRYKIAWKSNIMPTWVARAERVQVVEPLEGNDAACKVHSWESMSGFAAYIFKYAMGVPAELNEANMTYLNELKGQAEKLHRK